MAGNKNSLLKRLTGALLCRDMTAGGGNSTITADAAAGATVITLASATNFTVGDTVRVGSGSKTELAVLAAGSVSPIFSLVEPLGRAHTAGEPVVEQAAYDLGDITDSGVDITPSRQSTDVSVATKRLVYQVLLGYGDLDAALVLPGLTMENLAFALGIPLASILGNGASYTTPKALVTDLNDISNEQNASLICTGLLMDGTPIRVELWGIDPDYTGLSINLRRGTLAGVPCKYIATAGGRVSSNASSYVANTTYRANKGKVFDGLTEVGVFADETAGVPANTTIAAPAGGSNVAGQLVITVASAANMAAGDYMKLGSADTVEYHRVAGIAGLQITLDTKLLRDQAIGVTVVEQKLVKFANIDPAGVTLAVSGTVDRLNEATSVLSIGTRPGTAKATVGFSILDYTVAGFARAVGMDPALIVGGTLVLDERMGTANTDGVYIKGVMKDGTTIWMLLWGCSQDVARVAAKLASTGQPSLPTSWVPTSGIAMLNHA